MRSLFLASVVALSACKATPVLDGKPLTCSNDSTCPDGMRCFQGGCVTNTAPELEPLGLRFAQKNELFEATAVTTDAEEDEVTVTWTLVFDTAGLDLEAYGSILGEAHLGDTLSVTTADVLATYVFEVVADDGYDTTVSYLTLVAVDTPVADQVIYVSKNDGSDTETCGAPAAPCASIAKGLELGPNVAVAAAPTAYPECLSLSGPTTVWGGFDPDTWRFDPSLVARTEVTCTIEEDQYLDEPYLAGVGHHLTGTSVAGHLTLRLEATVVVVNPKEYIATAGVSDAAVLRVSTVVGPALPPPATPAGVLCDATEGRLVGVDVRGAPDSPDPPEDSVGVLLWVGKLTVSPLAGHGTIEINTPSTGIAAGAHNLEGELIIDDIDIRGGLATGLLGVLGQGGTTTVRNTRIDLRPFGTVLSLGILTGPTDCEPGNDPCTATDQPALTAENNVISIHGATDSFINTCTGGGISHMPARARDARPTQIAGNEIAIEGDVGLGFGVLAFGGATAVTGNTVTVNSSFANQDACAFFNAIEYPKAPLYEGAIGLFLAESDDLVASNTITLQPRVAETVGIFVRDAAGAIVQDNQITMAGPLDSELDELYWPAVGAELLTETGGLDPSTFARNSVLIGPHAGQGIALRMRGETHWLVLNNVLHGGETHYNTGLRIEVFRSTALWPRIAYNTIFGGTGLVSSAVRFGVESETTPTSDIQVNPAGPIGVFVNNLLDAGDGSQRRFLFDNRQGSSQTVDNASTNNIAQFVGDRRPTPKPVVTLFTGDTNDVFGRGEVHVALAASGTLATLRAEAAAGPTVVAGLGAESWLPVGHAFADETVWMGNSEATAGPPLFITGREGRVTIGRRWKETFSDITTFVFPEEYKNVVPKVVTFGEARGGFPLDVVFATATDGNGAGGLWAGLGAGAAGNSFLGPVKLSNDIELIEPGFIDLTYTDPDLAGTDRFWIVDEADTTPHLVVWPAFDALDSIDLPEIVSSFATGRVLGNNGGTTQEHRLLAAVGFSDTVTEHVVYLTSSGDTHNPDPPIPLTLSDPCGGDSEPVSAVALCRGWCADLWLGCANGRVESYRLNRPGAAWALVQDKIYDPVVSPSLPQFPVRSISVHANAVLTTYFDSEQVAVIPLTAAPNGDPRDPIGVTLVQDAGMRGGAALTYLDATQLPAEVPAAVDACNLRLRTAPGAPPPHPLSLTSPEGDCDGGAIVLDGSGPGELTVPNDYEGDTRDLTAPDVGADER